jgi:hypothetical protein
MGGREGRRREGGREGGRKGRKTKLWLLLSKAVYVKLL